VLAATNGGLYFSADSGASFSPVTSQVSPRGLFARGGTWYAATSGGVAISQDGGASWIVRGAADGIPSTANDVTFMP
jgi:hypothetical protein